MGYRFKHGESMGAGVRRVAMEQIDQAVGDLRNESKEIHERVHQARKRFKKLRALLRIVRPAMKKTYMAENVFFRDSARQLSTARDAAAVLETLALLEGDQGKVAGSEFFTGVRQALMARRDRVLASEAGIDAVVASVIAHLEQARERVGSWPVKKLDFGDVEAGLQLTYIRGQEGLKTAYKKGRVEDFHEWRKRVKYYWYHVRLLENVWPPLMKTWKKELKRLSDYLGDDHDLAVLHGILAEEDLGLEAAYVGQVQDLIEAERAHLQALARPLGLRLYAETPDAFTTRLAGYWKAWRAS